MTRCPFCGGKLVNKTITKPQSYQGKIYILENVPAETCQQCGEVFIAPQTLDKIQKKVWAGEEPSRKTEVPVYDLAKVK